MPQTPQNFAFPAAPSMGPGDILHIVFRHKWKITLISAAVVAGVAALFFFSPVPYRSEARVFVRYVLDSHAPGQGAANDAKLKVPSERGGETVINNEVEILTSLDLAQRVADKLPPDMLTRLGAATNSLQAAIAIQKGLVPEVGKRSDVIHIIFQHRDSSLVQPVLRQVVETYLVRQAEIHSAAGLYDEVLTRRRDDLRAALSKTQEDLRAAKAKAGSVFSVEATQKTYADQLARIEEAILESDAQLAERQAELSAISQIYTNAQIAATPATVSSVPAGSNASAATNAPPPVPSDKQAEYRKLLAQLESLNKQDQQLRQQYTAENRMVKMVQEKIVTAENLKQKLEQEYPGLLAMARPSDASALAARLELIAQAAKIPGLESKIRVLTNQLARIRIESTSLSAAEGSIAELEMTKKMQEAEFNSFQTALDQLHDDEQFSAGRISNVTQIQTASPPLRSASSLLKIAAVVLLGGIGGAFALAFALEYLDPSLKRPIEVERRLHLPLFISIPRLSLNGNGKAPGLSWARPPVPLLAERTEPEEPKTGETAAPAAPGPRPSAPAPWDPGHKMHAFCEALRYRLITFFELANLTHKPKLVALTSCSDGVGVSTIAASVAASLSETGDGNVLLVDMSQQGAAHEFYRGTLACGLDAALDTERRGPALVQDNLYVVSEGANGDRLPQALPRRFKHLVPRLKASDYDYIIFDMPPISQISITARLARFMDMVLIVAEAEKTDCSVLKRASAMLAESKANVGIVLNKSRTYVPRRLLQDL